MTCYMRQLTSLFETLGLDYDQLNRKRVDAAIRESFGFGAEAHCPEIWAAIKSVSREELAGRIADALRGTARA